MLPQTLDTVLTSFLVFLPKVIVAMVVFVAPLLLASGSTRVASRALEAREAQPDVVLLVGKLVRWSIIVLGTVIALQQVDVNLTAFLTGLGVLSDPAPKVVFDNLGASTIDSTLYYWVDRSRVGVFDAKDRAVVGVVDAFAKANIEMPYPTQTMRVHSQS